MSRRPLPLADIIEARWPRPTHGRHCSPDYDEEAIREALWAVGDAVLAEEPTPLAQAFGTLSEREVLEPAASDGRDLPASRSESVLATVHPLRRPLEPVDEETVA